ncbi:hypothetical protein B5M47_00740 [candidate division CPR3 bacterium 4484_211]|uniref:Uncharacterized protein n=1 Tax=candidate division CPR3 bacterium 4484_211 TaxID=1968527 RepID=A0A1W9NZ29_UNCC3|nr:MAG: hypothetical protein B5M47_00740 [candidate division CPR3 bacterium 4484_211]
MPGKFSPQLRIRYNKKGIGILLLLFILILTAFFCTVIHQYNKAQKPQPNQSRFWTLTSRILNNFASRLDLINKQSKPTPNPEPTPTQIPTPITPIIPKTLLTTNPNQAALMLSETILQMKKKNIPTVSVESFYLQGKEKLEKGRGAEALADFKTGYNLAQELILAWEYYRQ